MITLAQAQHPYLVGIKGVAQTALAACLIDAGKEVRGCDVDESFVTQPQLDKLGIHIDEGFAGELPAETDCVIYTSAHQANSNPVVTTAQQKGIATYSHAQALAELFNAKSGIAVCGVGGKSTTSAMLSWISQKLNLNWSYAVGVGEIMGLAATGRWSENSQYFIAEADEYVIDPLAKQKGEAITPRFSFLKPQLIICTNLKYDHPDVYASFDETKTSFRNFFLNLKPNGNLIINGNDANLVELAQQVVTQRSDITVTTYGDHGCSLNFSQVKSANGSTTAAITDDNTTLELTLSIPGTYNIANAVAAVAAAQQCGVALSDSVPTLSSFASTKRRIEQKGHLNGAIIFDDYAHHPDEVSQLLQGLRAWLPNNKLIIAFQPHTYSRTKALMQEFAHSLSLADEVLLLKIFASARENDDPEVTIEKLAAAITTAHPDLKVTCTQNLEQLATQLQRVAMADTTIVTVGAGDIYQVCDRLSLS